MHTASRSWSRYRRFHCAIKSPVPRNGPSYSASGHRSSAAGPERSRSASICACPGALGLHVRCFIMGVETSESHPIIWRKATLFVRLNSSTEVITLDAHVVYGSFPNLVLKSATLLAPSSTSLECCCSSAPSLVSVKPLLRTATCSGCRCKST
jgi:hypothetical protein